MKQNENKTTIHLKVTPTIQQKISSNINKLTLKKIKRAFKEMPENKKPFSVFLNISLDYFKKNFVYTVSTLKAG